MKLNLFWNKILYINYTYSHRESRGPSHQSLLGLQWISFISYYYQQCHMPLPTFEQNKEPVNPSKSCHSFR